MNEEIYPKEVSVETKSFTETTVMNVQIQGLQEETVLALRNTFMPFFEDAEKWKLKAQAITVTSPEQTDEMEMAREARIALKRIRVDVENTRKKLKEESLLKGKAIDGMANIIKYLIAPIEKHLQEQEDFVKRIEERQKAELVEKRTEELSKYEVDCTHYNLAEMSSEGYDQLLMAVEQNWEARKKAEQKIEDERIEREKAEAEERERIRKENERLQKELEARKEVAKAERKIQEKKEKERADKAQKEYEAKIEAERRERQRIEAELKAKKEAEEKAKREQEEKERKEREVHEAELEKERKKREQIEMELKAKKEAEEKAKLESEKKERKRVEIELKAKEEVERKEREVRLAPDKQKLEGLAVRIISMPLPELKSDEAKKILSGVVEILNQASSYIKEKSCNL